MKRARRLHGQPEEPRVHYLTLWLCLLIIVVFAAQNMFGVDLAWTVGSVHPNFFLSMIAHGSMAHLLGNLFGLLVFGLILEGVLGTRRYALVLLAAAIIGNLAGIGSYGRVLGISGAIYGVFGALATLRPTMVVWAAGMPMPMVLAALGWAFVDVLGLFAGTTGTAHLAHLAGGVAGIALGLHWRENRRTPRVRPPRSRKHEDDRIDKALDRWERDYMFH